MKSVCLVIAAATVPLAAAAQAVHFQVQCLPEQQQAEIKARAQAITEETERRKREQLPTFGPGMGLLDARKLHDQRSAALGECAAAAKKAGQGTLDACRRELTELRASAAMVDQLALGMKTHVDPIEQEGRLRLEQLRAQYPACPVPVTVKR